MWNGTGETFSEYFVWSSSFIKKYLVQVQDEFLIMYSNNIKFYCCSVRYVKMEVHIEM